MINNIYLLGNVIKKFNLEKSYNKITFVENDKSKMK